MDRRHQMRLNQQEDNLLGSYRWERFGLDCHSICSVEILLDPCSLLKRPVIVLLLLIFLNWSFLGPGEICLPYSILLLRSEEAWNVVLDKKPDSSIKKAVNFFQYHSSQRISSSYIIRYLWLSLVLVIYITGVYYFVTCFNHLITLVQRHR